MTSLAVLVVLSLPQAPAAAEPRFRWPPAAETPLRYTVRASKARALPDELAERVAAARRAQGLPRARHPRQGVELQIDVALTADAQSVTAAYETRLAGRPRLHWQLDEPREGAAAAALGNDRTDVWADADAAAPSVARDAVERAFSRAFRRGRTGGAVPASSHEHFGDHLLPVLWDQPLPCWIGHMANVLELSGEAAIAGKTLIRDGNGSFPLGHRESRVELEFTRVSGDSFAFTYELTVRQRVSTARDLSGNVDEPWEWHFAVAGEAEYSVADQAFVSVRERVTAHPEGLGEARLARLHDEAFTGTIEVARTRGGAGGRRRRR